ncbi:hypothetical protein [Paraclostridium sordellii]|nr:hypothetical protein [Paeniclostridium sordellii]
MLNLTTKERMLLEDEKSHEDLCVKNIMIIHKKLLFMNFKIYLAN